MDWEVGGAGSGADSGVRALATLLAVHKMAVDPQQLRHELGHDEPLSADDILRLAKRQDGVRARVNRISFNKLARQPLPVLANGPEGWFLIGRATDTEVLIQRPGSNVEKLAEEGLGAIWSGEIILLTTRESVGGAAGRFDIRWFIPQVVRYRKLIGEVLLITLALNLLGLAAPLFFQNVIDKVLVHNTLATLQVLSVGFVAVSLWEVTFGWLRTRLYSETSQKLDVELGSKLFRHMLGLPLSYFEGRRVGDTVTRVRQLESIREFLTNASLSVLIDPVFTIVFLIAMWIYPRTTSSWFSQRRLGSCALFTFATVSSCAKGRCWSNSIRRFRPPKQFRPKPRCRRRCSMSHVPRRCCQHWTGRGSTLSRPPQEDRSYVAGP